MRNLLPPLCLLMALAMLIAGFALWSIDAPSETVELSRARVSGDEAFEEVLEARLETRQFARKVLLGCLFGGSLAMVIVAFLTMQQVR